MLVRSMMVLAVTSGALVPLVAQERTPVRHRVWVGDDVRPFDLLVSRRARIGVTLDMAAVENDSIGATIASVTPGGPAADAGIRSGDIITRLNGRTLVRAERERDRDRDRARDDDDEESLAALTLIEMVAKLDPGDTVTVEYRRGQETRSTTLVTSRERGLSGVFPEGGRRFSWPVMPRSIEGPGYRDFTMTFGGPFAELELAPMNPDLGAYFGTVEGVLVIDAPEKNTLGLKGGDVILSIDGRKARGPQSLLRILRSYEDGDVVKLEVMRNRSRQTISSKVDRDED